MASVDYKATAQGILDHVGGEDNVLSATHCATRLRLKLRDASKADTQAVERTPGVITVMQAGGQYQVVIGNNVPKVYAALGEISRLTGDDRVVTDDGPKGNILNQFIQLISSIFLPVLWPLAGVGLLKAFLTMAVQFSWIDVKSTTYIILNASADGLFYFLPMFLAVTAAKRFRANQFTAMAIAGALVYPAIVALGAATGPVTFFGIPVTMMSYTSSVIPIVVGVWVQGYLERFLERVLPDALRNFMVPLLTVLVMVPLIFITVGPITTYAAKGISTGVTAIFTFAPWLGGAIMGGLWQVFVLFGLHWGFVPVMINDLSTQGYSLLAGPLVAAVVAQGAAMAAIAIRSRSAKRREIAGPASISALFAGITEPGIYGATLPLKIPFYAGIAGGAVGGAIAAIGGSGNTTFAFASLLALPAWNHGSFAMQVIGDAVAMIIAFVITFIFMDRESKDVDAAIPDAVPAAATVGDAPSAPVAGSVATTTTTTTTTAAATADAATEGGIVDLAAPVTGTVVPLAQVNDKVFASGVLGDGVGIVPTDGTVRAPVTGTVVTAAATGHAFGLKTDDGVEVLVHVGIDTVQLDGRHFTVKVSTGDRVQRGDVLAEVDLVAVGEAGYDTTTIMTVTNTAALTKVTPLPEATVTAGDAVVAVQP